MINMAEQTSNADVTFEQQEKKVKLLWRSLFEAQEIIKDLEKQIANEKQVLQGLCSPHEYFEDDDGDYHRRRYYYVCAKCGHMRTDRPSSFRYMR